MLVFIAEEGKGSKEKGKKKNEILIKVVDISPIAPKGSHFSRLFIVDAIRFACLTFLVSNF